MDSERPFTFGVVIGFHSQVRCQGPFMSDSPLSRTAAYKLKDVQ